MIDIFEILKRGKEIPQEWQAELIKNLINPHMTRVIIGAATLDMFVGGGDVRRKVSNIDMLNLISPDLYVVDIFSRIYEDDDFYSKALIKGKEYFSIFESAAEKEFLKKYTSASEEEKKKVATGLHEVISKIKSFDELEPLVEDGIKRFLDKRGILFSTRELKENNDNPWTINDPLYEEAGKIRNKIDSFKQEDMINLSYIMLSILDIDQLVKESLGQDLNKLKGKMILAKIAIENDVPNAGKLLKYATTNIAMRLPRSYLPEEIEDVSFRLHKEKYYAPPEEEIKEVGKAWVLSKDAKKIKNIKKKLRDKPNLFGF